ncbi:MAG TPA: hypothetical protein VJP79_11920 [Nitrososphaera sp.]|nr:hypothetical protein [Nitrososphaera sp.]
MAPFGFFKKKEKGDEPSSASKSSVDHQQQSSSSPPAIPLPQDSSLSIQEAQALLQDVEGANLRALSSRLAPIKASAEQILKSIGILASDMEQEKIKLEDLEQRFKSLVENSRKTVVTTLRRESSTELELPESVNDVRKFREKLEAMMKRFGEVTGSHSKILNNFMRKHSSRMKDEFEALRELATEAKSIIADFEQKRGPIIKCGALLNTASQKAATMQATEASIKSVQKEMSDLDEELAGMQTELDSLTGSPQYHEARSRANDLAKMDEQRDELRGKIVELFSPVSRAFTKYSYGVSRDIETRLNVMSSEPWKLLDMADISEYQSLLAEVRKSVSSGKIQLKDTDKMIHYIDLIALTLPDFQSRSRQIVAEIDSLKSYDDSSYLRSRQLEQKIAELKERLSRGRDNIELLRRQNEERKAEVSSLLAEASGLLTSVSGRHYEVTANADASSDDNSNTSTTTTIAPNSSS